ncbi:MAG: rhodanese-like domain-containing protein [Chloroflexota bacterium]|nr:rhodanese-like domain-containing protein [Chloroflexota bacterium]
MNRDATLALLDVREHGEYNRAHIAGASSLPRRQIEYRLERLVPFKGVPLVICDDTGRRARLAAQTIERMGYADVAILDGGVNRWASEGYPTEWGMNVPSKDFGERVEMEHHVLTVDARELREQIQRGEEVVILDTRTPEEYRRFCIPGGRSLPGGELAYRIGEIVEERPDATVVVNCAGRTRSIIGARVLQRMGLRNVVSLKNGTSGWVLAGYQLEAGADRVELPEPSAEARSQAEAFARRVAAEDGVTLVSVDELRGLMERVTEETVYLVDVRTEEEFSQGHIPGFWWFPGGQAVQRADDLVAVRNGRIVFCDDRITRAAITASWYRQMGYPHVYAVDGGTTAWVATGHELEQGMAEREPFGLAEARQSVRQPTPAELCDLLRMAAPPVVIFVGTSREFAAGHVPGAHWMPRGWLELRIEDLVPDWTEPIVVTDVDGVDALLAARTLGEMGYHDVAALGGGMRAWSAVGLPVEQGLSGVMEPPNDVVPAGPERSFADMIEYLRWEEALGAKYAEKGGG